MLTSWAFPYYYLHINSLGPLSQNTLTFWGRGSQVSEGLDLLSYLRISSLYTPIAARIPTVAQEVRFGAGGADLLRPMGRLA